MYELDPRQDSRWPEFLERHPHASVFHSRGWIQSLSRTYGYEPVAYTTCAPGAALTNALVFCRVKSGLTGPRLVSLPFSDHSEPLVDTPETLESLLAFLYGRLKEEHWKYIELRPLHCSVAHVAGFGKSAEFYVHRLDLHPPLAALLDGFHKSNVQAKIRRAEREQLTYEAGRSEALLSPFYRLFVLTCRRRRLPPQPIDWFRHLIECMGEGVKIHVAFKARRPVASILTLTFKRTLVYKYGCSDSSLNNLGGTHLLFWNAIQEAKRDGLHEFDLGRSDLNTPGLVTFKDRWGTTRSMMHYVRCPAPLNLPAGTPWSTRIAKPFFGVMSDRLLIAAGRTLYRHMG